MPLARLSAPAGLSAAGASKCRCAARCPIGANPKHGGAAPLVLLRGPAHFCPAPRRRRRGPASPARGKGGGNAENGTKNAKKRRNATFSVFPVARRRGFWYSDQRFRDATGAARGRWIFESGTVLPKSKVGRPGGAPRGPRWSGPGGGAGAGARRPETERERMRLVRWDSEESRRLCSSRETSRAGVRPPGGDLFSESLILAQNERWQRGLGMQVGRQARIAIPGPRVAEGRGARERPAPGARTPPRKRG